MTDNILQFVAVTSGGRAFDIEFPLHPETRSATSVSDLVTRLLEERILVVPGTGFGRPGYFRLSFCVTEQSIVNAMDGFATSHVLTEARMPEPELLRDYLGDPAGRIKAPTVAQEMLFGAKGRVFQLSKYLDRHVDDFRPVAYDELTAWMDANADAIAMVMMLLFVLFAGPTLFQLRGLFSGLLAYATLLPATPLWSKSFGDADWQAAASAAASDAALPNAANALLNCHSAPAPTFTSKRSAACSTWE